MQVSSPPGPATPAQALDFQRRLDRALATRVEELPWGASIHRDDLPHVTDLNVLIVEHVPPGLFATAVMVEADRFQAGLPQRAVRVDDPEAAPYLAPHFAAAGWIVCRTALMLLRRPPDRLVSSSDVTEVGVDQVHAAREAAIGRVHRDLDVAAEAVAVGALQHEDAPVRAFAALVGGEVAAYCLLRMGEGGAKLVEVEALARAQGHGLGRATIWAAISAARRDRANPIFVECEDKEWEKSVYRRLGFDEAGKVHRFIRPWGDPASGRFSFAY